MGNGDGTRHQDIEEGCLKAQEELDCLDLSELEPEAKAPLRARRKKCPRACFRASVETGRRMRHPAVSELHHEHIDTCYNYVN